MVLGFLLIITHPKDLSNKGDGFHDLFFDYFRSIYGIPLVNLKKI